MINTKEIIETLEKIFNETISLKDTKIIFTELKNRKGFYDLENDIVYIDNTCSKIDREFTLVHELGHRIMNIYKISILNLEIKEVQSIEEIACIILEVVYSHKVFGEYGFNLMKFRLIENTTWFNTNIRKAIFNLKDKEVKNLLINELNIADIKIG